MTIFKVLQVCLLLFCLSTSKKWAGKAIGQNAEILGLVESWAGKEVYLTAQKDPICRTLSIIDSDLIAPDGTFKLEADTGETVLYWVRVNRFKTPIWVEPGKKYNISIIPVPENKLVETWQNGSFNYAFLSLDSTDINRKLADFDTRYYDFYLDNSEFIGTSQLKKKVAEFINQFKNSKEGSVEAIYKEYTFAEMKLSSGFKKEDLYNTYLKNQPVQFQNTAYYNFFDLFYGDYFQSYDSKFGGATIANRLKKGISADSVYNLLNLDYFLENETIRQFVLLKSIEEVYSNAAYPLKSLNQILNFIIQNPASEEVANIASRLAEKLNYKIIGIDFRKLSANWRPQATLNKNDTLPTILFVSSDGSIESEREASLLNIIQSKYSDFVRFEEIIIGNIKNASERSWLQYSPNNSLEFLDQFEIYRFPHFIWVDSDGKVLENGIEKPSQGLERRLFKIKADYNEKNRIKVGK